MQEFAQERPLRATTFLPSVHIQTHESFAAATQTAQTNSENSEPRISRVATVTHLPQLNEYTNDPSILPLRNKVTLAECEPQQSAAQGATPLLETFVQRANWLKNRVVSDRLLLVSWICIVILSVMVFVNPMGRTHREPTNIVPLTVTHSPPPKAESPVVVAVAEPTPNPFGVVSSTENEASLNPDTPAEHAVTLDASPWERAVTSSYSPWNTATAPTVAANSTVPAAAVTAAVSNHIENAVADIPTGFAGYDPARSLGNFAPESELVMRPATPLAAPQHNYQAAPPAAPAYQIQQTRPIYGQVPVAQSPQTFRGGSNVPDQYQYAQPVAPPQSAPAPAYTTSPNNRTAPPPNTTPHPNYQVAAVPYAPSGYYIPAPPQTTANPAAPRAPAVNSGVPQNAPVIW